MSVEAPNDLKLSDRRGWRDRCAAGGKAAAEAAGVTAAPVRCSAWLGDLGTGDYFWGVVAFFSIIAVVAALSVWFADDWDL